MKSISVALALLSSTLSIGGPASILSNANNISFNNELKFDNTNVLDDLLSSDDFNILDYPYKENEGIKIINFIEYEYSFYSNLQSNYSLYIYLYNPGNLNINVNSNLNKIQLATHWNDDHYPDEYKKFNLKFLNKSEDSTHYNLFYKFKIDLSDSEKADLLANLNSNERRYDISGIELFINNEQDVIEYPIGGTYKFSGYSEGLGQGTIDNLTCNVTDLETVELEVHPTFYRLDSSSKGANYQAEIDSVYFSIPNYYLETYGNLQKIKAEWYEYKTSPILVIENQDAYNELAKYIGIYDNYASWDNYNFYTDEQLAEQDLPSIGTISQGLPEYNSDSFSFRTMYHKMGNTGWEPLNKYSANCKAITWLFSTNGASYEDYIVSSEQLLSYAVNYSHFNEGKNVNGLSNELFKGKVEEGRSEGYNLIEFDANEDKMDLLNYEDTHSAWEKFREYLFRYSPEQDSVTDIPVIYEVKDDLSNNYFTSDNLLIDTNDINEFVTYYEESQANNKTTFLFRFATNNYFSQIVQYNFINTFGEPDGYVSRATYFADFDIISLTFSKDGEYKVIPVVHSPIDIVGDLTPPLEEDSWLERLLQILIGIGILGLSIFLIYKLIKAIGEYSRS